MSNLLYYGWLMESLFEKYNVPAGSIGPEGAIYRFSYDTRLTNLFSLGGALPAVALIAFLVIVAYLLGSLNFALIISKLFYHDDIRKYGSGNAGMTNMIRTYGKGAGALTLLGDALKAVVSVMLAMLLAGEGAAYIAALACTLGHVFPIFYKFKGGKGVVVASASILCLNPLTFLVLLIVFIGIVYASKYISLGSIIAAFFYPMILAAFSSQPSLIRSFVSILIAAFVIALHKSNIRRLMDRTENKFSLKSKKEGSDKKEV